MRVVQGVAGISPPGWIKTRARVPAQEFSGPAVELPATTCTTRRLPAPVLCRPLCGLSRRSGGIPTKILRPSDALAPVRVRAVTHAAAMYRRLDRAYLEALARDGADHGHAHALVASRNRMQDLRTMSGQSQAKVLFATLAECTSARGSTYLRGWAGASNLVGFRGDDDEQG